MKRLGSSDEKAARLKAAMDKRAAGQSYSAPEHAREPRTSSSMEKLTCSDEKIKIMSINSEGNQQHIQFPTGNRYLFSFVQIASDVVSAITMVDASNPRQQNDRLDETTEDLGDSVRSSGVMFGVWAELREDGMYCLIDGSRRRYRAIKDGVSLPVWYTKEKLTTYEKLYLIQTTTLTRSFSYYEGGKLLDHYMADNPELSVKDVCAAFQINESSFSRKMSAYKLVPLEVYALFPSGIDIKTTILFSLFNPMRKLQATDPLLFSKFIEKVKNEPRFKKDSDAFAWLKRIIFEISNGEFYKPKAIKKKPEVQADEGEPFVGQKNNGDQEINKKPISQSLIGNLKVNQYDRQVSIAFDEDFDIERLLTILKENFK